LDEPDRAKIGAVNSTDQKWYDQHKQGYIEESWKNKFSQVTERGKKVQAAKKIMCLITLIKT